MVDQRDGCIDEIVAAVGGRMSRRNVQARLGDFYERVDGDRSSARSRAEKYAAAAEDILAKAAEQEILYRRAARMDALKKVDRRKFYAAAPTPRVGMEAKLVGVNRAFAGSRLSTAAQHVALKKEWQGGLVLDLERAGADKLFASRAIEDDWARELFEVSHREAGRLAAVGSTKNPMALKIAETIHRWQKASIDALNREGAWVKSYTGYITRTSHDPDAIRRAGKDKWVADTLPLLDWRRTFATTDEAYARSILGEIWAPLRDGDHFDYSEPVDDQPVFPNLAAKASAMRELHFKTADDWLKYNKAYGLDNPTATVMRSFDTAARRAALLREFGTRPQQAFEEDMNFLKHNARGTDAFDDLAKWDQPLRNRFAQLDGTANRPVNRAAANIATGWMSLQRMAKLGRLPATMISEVGPKISELRYQGIPWMDRYTSAISGYFRGRGRPDSERRAVADLLRAGLDSRLGSIANQFDIADAPRGKLAALENLFFRMTGVSAMSSNGRADVETVMARNMGLQHGKPYETMDAPEQRIMKLFGIEKPEWDLLHRAAWLTFDDRAYLTPDIAHNVPDAAVEAYLRDKGAVTNLTKPERLPEMVAKAKADLALKLATYFSDRSRYAVFEPGARERAMIFQNTKAGSPMRIALQLLWQFKQWPLEMVTKTWGRTLYGGTTSMEKLAGIPELIIASTLFGVASNAVSDLFKLQDPFSQITEKPWRAFLRGFTRGGAGTIMGDYLMGEYDRHGMIPLESLAGPTFGQIDTVVDMVTNWERSFTEAKKSGGERRQGMADLLRLVDTNVPFANMWWTAKAFDYLLMYRLQEAINPGYLDRMERRMKDQQGTQFLLSPAAVAGH